jgi:palmitoyltransferase
VQAIKFLIESDKAKPNDRDFQDVTPLHWAAINNHVPAVRYLIEQGAEVDAFGGDLVATPVHWAARLVSIHDGAYYVARVLSRQNSPD